MTRYELLRKIANHTQGNPSIAMYVVAYLSADVPDGVLAGLMNAVLELEEDTITQKMFDLVFERFGRRPDSTR